MSYPVHGKVLLFHSFVIDINFVQFTVSETSSHSICIYIFSSAVFEESVEVLS